MLKGFVLSAAAGAFLAFAAPVNAMPIAPGVQAPDSDVIHVARGCGRGFHPGPYGRCIRNLEPTWPCWWTRGPFGRWRLVCR